MGALAELADGAALHHEACGEHDGEAGDGHQRRRGLAEREIEQEHDRRQGVAVGLHPGRAEAERGVLGEEEADEGGQDREVDDAAEDDRLNLPPVGAQSLTLLAASSQTAAATIVQNDCTRIGSPRCRRLMSEL